MRREGSGHCGGCQEAEGLPAAHSAMAASSAAIRCMGKPWQLITAMQAFGKRVTGRPAQDMLSPPLVGGADTIPALTCDVMVTHVLLAMQALRQFSVGGKASHAVAQRAAKALSEHHLLKLSVPTV